MRMVHLSGRPLAELLRAGVSGGGRGKVGLVVVAGMGWTCFRGRGVEIEGGWGRGGVGWRTCSPSRRAGLRKRLMKCTCECRHGGFACA